MREKYTFAENVLGFNECLANVQIDLPTGFKLINPFNGENREQIKK